MQRQFDDVGSLPSAMGARQAGGMGGSRPVQIIPIEQVRFTAENYDEATEFIRQTYFDDKARFSSRAVEGKYASHNLYAGAAIAVDQVRSALDFTVHSAPVEYVSVGHLRRGTLRRISGDEDLRLTSGDVFMAPAGVPSTSTVSRFAVQGMRIPAAVVKDLAATRADTELTDLRFHSGQPVSPAMARYWRSMLALIVDELSVADSAFTNPLVTEQMQRQLATAVLAAFPNSTMTTHRRAPDGFIPPAAVRRAVAYIDDYADQPLRLADIAAAAGVRPRALQYAFNRYYGATPVGYLIQVRLERAHRDLQAADPSRGATVAAIARRWGFASPSRFGAVYRAAYGQPPGHTLRS